jgi:hypothetical protein
MCRCGGREFEHRLDGQTTVELLCRSCQRRYAVKKLEKRIRISNLPMSFGYRSLYWDKIEAQGGSISGVTEEGYEIREIEEGK